MATTFRPQGRILTYNCVPYVPTNPDGYANIIPTKANQSWIDHICSSLFVRRLQRTRRCNRRETPPNVRLKSSLEMHRTSKVNLPSLRRRLQMPGSRYHFGSDSDSASIPHSVFYGFSYSTADNLTCNSAHGFGTLQPMPTVWSSRHVLGGEIFSRFFILQASPLTRNYSLSRRNRRYFRDPPLGLENRHQNFGI